MSNDARSGNANRHVLVRYLLVQIACPKSLSTFWASGRPIRHLYFKRTLRTSQTNNQHQSSDMTASTRGVNLAVTKQLSDTIFSSQCMHNRHRQKQCKRFFLQDEIAMASITRTSVRRRSFAAPSGASPKGVRREDKTTRRRPVGLAKPYGLELF